MNWLDILIALLVTIPAFFGFRKGFLRKLLGIVGIILGFILAVKFYDTVALPLSAIVKGNPVFVNVLAFLLIIAILYGTAIWLARFIASMNSGTTMIDKILGTVVGFIQGVIVASVLLFNFSLADIPSQGTRQSSLFYPTVVKIAPAIFDKVIDLFPGLKSMYDEYKYPLKQLPGGNNPESPKREDKKNK